MWDLSRRALLKTAGASAFAAAGVHGLEQSDQKSANDVAVLPNMLGAYGNWAAGVVEDPPRLSFRQSKFTDAKAWQPVARSEFRNRLMQPVHAAVPVAETLEHFESDGLSIEHLRWQVPFGPPTEALFLKPLSAKAKLPGIVGLHDHGSQKYFGMRKITQTPGFAHPVITRHQDRYYEGVAWANALARRGYAVLVHDTFAFGSRRIRIEDVPDSIQDGAAKLTPGSEEEIGQYNKFAAQHEHVVAKSLFCAGLTWPGVFVFDDQRALDYLASRPDVEPTKLGCIGLSGGGLRTVMLAGADDRIRCSCCVGMMSTWRDYLLNKSFTHTWMLYVPGLAHELDYPELLGLGVPNPVLVLNNNQDALFTLAEMHRADAILKEIYKKADAPEHYRASFYDGPHKFDRKMQAEAFEWFDRWLKGV